MTKHTEPDIQARTVAGFCAAYGVGVTTTYALISAGKLRTVKAGRRTLIVEASAREWLLGLAHSVAPCQAPASDERRRIRAMARAGLNVDGKSDL